MKNMCEFNVFLDGKSIFKDVYYAKNEEGGVVLKNVLGEVKQVSNCVIAEVDVNTAKLILNSTET
ncbi:MAG: CooT family nickel-binding protein [Crenarchaeota archaeon]|nr:CooT family nickel-binding protein [Thermoproteota archaeon]